MQVEGRGIKSIKVAGRILNVMVENAHPITLSEIAVLAGVNASQAHTYLTSFRRFGLVEQDDNLGRYYIGPAAMRLAAGHLQSTPWRKCCLETVSDLSVEFGRMITLVAWGSQGPTVIQIRDGGSNLNLSMRAGTVLSITGTVSGRIFGAYGTSPLIEDLIKAEIERSHMEPMGLGPISEEQYRATIKKIRQVGLAWAGGVPIPNVNAVGVPVFGPDGQIRFSMSMIEFAELMPVGEESVSVLRLREVASQISELARQEGEFNANIG
jgi:DNA-binding IclR family transcriptional regulator